MPGPCPRSPDGRHHWETVTPIQDTIERQICAYCLVGFEDAPVRPEPPDFEQIADALSRRVGAIYDSQQPIVDALRQVWNARGAADLDALEPAVGMFPSVAMDEAIAAIEALDR